MSFTITEMFAFVANDNGTDGIIGRLMPDGTWMPFVGADRARVESLMPHAQAIADASGVTIRIVRFTVPEQIGTVTPRASSTARGFERKAR